MTALGKQIVAIYVDRLKQQFVVLDPDGRYWALSHDGDPWNQRQPYSPTEETELEPVPGHYKQMLGLPN
jgi:hypothetical protein